jgi:hypothetical protein
MEQKSNRPETYRQKLWEIVERDFSVSLMNDTKWTEAVRLLREMGLRCRVKLITRDAPSPLSMLAVGRESRLPLGYVEGCGYSPFRTLEIEWLDIDPVSGFRPGQPYAVKPSDHSEELEGRLRSLGVAFTRDGPVIRIWGHIRR